MTIGFTAITASAPIAVVIAPTHDEACWVAEGYRHPNVRGRAAGVRDQISPLIALAARAEALALLVEAGEMEVEEALGRLGVVSKQYLCEEVIERLVQEYKANESPRLQELRHLLDPNISFERGYHELNNDSQRWPTPSTTVEAIMQAVRERGVAALNDSANIERLSRCSAAAKAQVDRRISELKKLGRIA